MRTAHRQGCSVVVAASLMWIARPALAAPDVPPPPAPSVDTVDSVDVAPAVESVFDLGLDAPPPPAPTDAAPGTAPVVEADPPSAPLDTVAPDPEPTPSPAPSPPLKRPPPSRVGVAGWSLLVGTFAVGASASLFVGFAERERVRTRRIGIAYDLYTDQPRALPQDIAAILAASKHDRAVYQRVALGLGAAAGGLLVSAVVLLSIETVRRKRSSRRAATIGRTLVGIPLRF